MAGVTQERLKDILFKYRGSRKLVLLVVAIAILLDNMLLTSVVPIIPSYLYELNHEKQIKSDNLTLSSESKSDNLVTPVSAQTVCDGNNLTQFSGIKWNKVSLPPKKLSKHDELMSENFEVGVMFASKPVVQALTNPFIGILTNRIGYSIPLFVGFIIMFLSTLIFAMGKTYMTLFIARSLQGVGSSCTFVAGMGLLAAGYTDDKERGSAMAIALGGLALGVLIGPPFGGLMYEFVGRSAPFVILAILSLLDGLFQLLILELKISYDQPKGESIKTLIKDPYIMVAAGAVTVANMGIAVLEPSLPLWMMDTMSASNWEQGAAFLPASISYLIGTNVFGPLGHKLGRWLASMIGFILIGFSLICIPMAQTVNQLIIPNGIIGFAIGVVDSSMMPMLGYLVDIRHTSVYGPVYAIGDVALCAAFALGPVLSSTLVQLLGFEGLVFITAIICFMFSPLLYLLKNPPGHNKEENLLQGSTIKYVTYTDSPDEDEDYKPLQVDNHP